VWGPPTQQMSSPVPWADYVYSILADFDECDSRLTQTYAVLSVARVWVTLATGQGHSKESGTNWVLERVPSHLHTILEWENESDARGIGVR